MRLPAADYFLEQYFSVILSRKHVCGFFKQNGNLHFRMHINRKSNSSMEIMRIGVISRIGTLTLCILEGPTASSRYLVQILVGTR